MKRSFKKSVHAAVANATLSGALGKFSETYKVSRARAYQGMDFEALRSVIANRKSYAASHLDRMVADFTRNAEALGAKVYVADSPEKARDYLERVAKENNVKTVVKSKSMASEEIHLNGCLEKNGITVRETDLGEWIIQLAGQKPSHMVMPAIHMSKEEVSDLFSKEVDERLTTDIPRLVEVARKEMRSKFLTADMGISGGNIAVAETGSIVLVTNEGNARMVTTLPKIHIALVGIEKLVEKFEDIVPILTALPRSATGQLLTSYVSIISGPVPNTDGTLKDLHLILMDNRRTEMAADPKFKQAMQCIRCGSCLNVCPVFRIVGGHVFGSVYTGGIGAILTAWFDELRRSDDIQGLCIQCGNCKEVCPGKLDIPDMIMELRRRLVIEKGEPLVQKAIFTVVHNRRLFHAMLRAASIGGTPLTKGRYIRHLPMFLSGLTDGRSLPAIAMAPFRDRFRKIRQPSCGEKAAFYAGCLIDFAYPEMGEALVSILNRADIEVTFPDGQTCCGAPARYSGVYEVAERNAIDNIRALLEDEVTYVVSACPTCTVALARDFMATFESVGQTDWMPQAKKLAEKTIDFSTLAKKLVDEGRLTLKDGCALGKITYHDSCHMKRTLNVFEQPRALLEKAGYEITEMVECDMCCGMGGSYSLKLPEISAPILQRKLTNIKNTGAPIVATDCPGCIMQIRGGVDQDGAAVEVRHTLELLAGQVE
jgi:L-lactate dehydrogenase complex protein LldF